MRRRAPKVSLSAEQRDDLERVSRSRTLEARLVERSRIVLRAAAGQDNQEIAEAVGLCRQTVGHWRECFVAEGIHGLEDRPRSGRPARILTPTINEIVRLTTQSTPVAATHWSTRTLAAETQVSFSTIGRIWRAHGLKPHRIESFKLSNDPRFGEKLQDVVPLYLHPPEGAVVISVDEKCQIQALQRTQPGLPWKKGRCGTMTHDYKRHGTTSLFAALNVLEGTVIGECHQRHRHQEFLKFLRRIDREFPAGRELHLILDNYGTHTHPTVKDWLSQHPRFSLHFTPTGASWLNLVERWFRELTDKRIRRGVFHSVDDLKKAIQEFLSRNNREPQPFVWTASVESILEKISRCKAIYETLH